MSRMTKIKKMSTAWFVVLSFVLQLVYPLAPVEVQAAGVEIKPEDRIEVNKDLPPEPKGWATKPHSRWKEYKKGLSKDYPKGYYYLYDMARDLGYGDLSQIDTNKFKVDNYGKPVSGYWDEIKKFYETYCPWNTVRANHLESKRDKNKEPDKIDEYDIRTVDNRSENGPTTDWKTSHARAGYVRRTEIVPIGEEPKSKVTKRFIRDDGTFVPPTEAKQIKQFNPLPSEGPSKYPRPVFGFGENFLKYNWKTADLNGVTAQWLPRTGHGEAAVYQTASDTNLYYCINVNSGDASVIPGKGAFLQSGRYSSQSNFRDISEIPFILQEIGEKLGIDKIKSSEESGQIIVKMVDATIKLYDEYKRIYNANDSGRKEPCTYYSGLTTGKVQDMLNKILTKDGQEATINNKKIRPQTDTRDPKSLESLISTGGMTQDEIAGSFVLGIEYAFSHYAIGMPIEEIDQIESEYVYTDTGKQLEKTKANKYYARAIARLFIAYTEAAREEGLLKNYELRSDLEAKLVRKRKNKVSNETELTIRLTNAQGADKVTAIIPNEFKLVSPQLQEEDQDKTTYTNKTIYTLPGNKTQNEYEITVSFNENDITTDDMKQIDFAVYKEENVLGRVWAPVSCYKFDKESGHWIVLEYVSSDKDSDGNTNSFLFGQQLVSFTEQYEQVRRSVRVDITKDPVPSLATTAETKNEKNETKQASKEQPIIIEGTTNQTVTVSDTIAYDNLQPDRSYEVKTSLQKVNDDGITSTPVKPVGSNNNETEIVTRQSTDASGKGEWKIELGKYELETNAKYVIFETATLIPEDGEEQTDPIEHKELGDKAQTIVMVFPKGTLRTTVTADTVTSSAIKVANVKNNPKGISVTDTITYENLVPGEKYTVTAELVEVLNENDPTDPTKSILSIKTVQKENLEADSSGRGEWTIDFGNVTGLKEGSKYVVYETATSNNSWYYTQEKTDGDKTTIEVVKEKMVIEHKDKTDNAQTFVVSLPKGKLITTVTSGELTGTKDKELRLNDEQVEAGVSVEDIVDCTDMIPNATYELTGRLMHIAENGEATVVVGPVTKEVQTDGNGKPIDNTSDKTDKWIIDFGTVTGLNVGEKYVVYEKAVSIDNHWFVNQNGEVEYGKIEVTHEDANDKAQTILAGRQKGRLRTTVNADGHDGSSNANASVPIQEVKDGITVKDTVAYENLVPNTEYYLTGTLMHIAEDGTATAVQKDGKDLSIGTDVKTNNTGTSEPGDEWKIDFGTVTGLNVGEKYVVYEVAISKENVLDSQFDGNIDMKQVVEHKDPNDKAQTFVIELKENDGTLRTTVSANDEKSTADQAVSVAIGEAKKGVHVVDTIHYTNLAPKETYEVQATLMHVPSVGEITPVSGCAVITNTFTTDEKGFGEWTVDFGVVKGLETGEKYVVYEVATSNNLLVDTDKDGVGDKQHTVRHEDPTDKAQTVVVEGPKKLSEGTLRTTVTANDKTGTDSKEATLEADRDKMSVQVKDTVTYTNLVPNEEYKLEATLVHVSKSGITPVTGTSIVLKADKSGNGQWEIDFGVVEGLKAGEKYVIYEVATSEQELIDTDNDGKPDTKEVIEHKDPSDKAQTIVIEEPVVPNVPEKPEPEPEDNSLGGTLRTTIVADGVEGSSSSAAVITDKDAIDAGISVKDTVYYEGLVAGETYVLEGTLMHIKKDGSVEPVTGAYKRQYVVTSSTGSGQWEVNFGVVKGLQIGEKYVVYEKATSVNLLEDTDNDKKPDTKHIITHEDPNDTAQTLLLKNPEPEKPEKPEEPKEEKPTTPSTSNNKKKGSLRTTVVAANQTGTKDKAVWVPSRYEKTDASIKDIVYYTNLVPNAKYELEATLMHVRQDGTVTPVRGATVKQIVVADSSGNGVWEVDFGVVKDLVKEEKYVVYEKATSVDYILDTDRDDLYDSKHIVIHQDPNDTAQTIFVKSERAVGFYLKGQLMPMEEDMTLLGNPVDENKKDPHLTLFGQTQPDFGYVEDKNLNHPSGNKYLPQTGSILSNTALLVIGAMITLAGGVLLVPRRKQNK